MIKDEYSLYKLVHHGDALAHIRRGIQPKPIQAHLIPTNRCNQDCVVCAYRRQGYQSNQNFNPREQMSRRVMMRLIDDLADLGTMAIQFTGGGEPLLHPDICEALELTKKRGMALALVTNGVLLGDRQRAALSGASWIRVSLDAACPERYSAVKNVFQDVFRVVVGNIEAMVKDKGDSILGVGFVVQEWNWQDTYEAARLVRDLGVDNIRISAAFTPMGASYFDGFLQHAADLAGRAEELSCGDFTVFNLFNERLAELFSGEQRYPYCHYKDLVPYVGADLNVYSCCVKAYTGQGLMGHFKGRQTFRDFWLGRGKQIRYKAHDPSMVCRHPCMFERKNEFIDYCVKANPRHVEFV